MQVLMGFIIGVFVGLTGIGGGSFTTPLLLLVTGLSGAEAVGTALTFSMVLRILAAPFYIAGKQVHFRYLKLMLIGAFPGLLGGTYILAILNVRRWNEAIFITLGVLLISSAVLTVLCRNRRLLRSDASWLPWLTLPIGVETGFSSAGAGALGSIFLLNCPEMSASKVVGTDLLFGIVLAAGGSLLHFAFGSISVSVLKGLLWGGVPGVLLGCLFAPNIPATRLRSLIVGVTLLLGFQLIWSGVHGATH